MAFNRPLIIDSMSYLLGITLGQMRLSIKIRIILSNSNILGYLPMYKSLLPLLVKLSGPQPYKHGFWLPCCLVVLVRSMLSAANAF